MRRTALTIVATIIGLVLLLGFKTHSPGGASGGLASLGSVPATSGSPRPGRGTTGSQPPAPSAAPSSHHSTAPATSRKASKHPAKPRVVTAIGQVAQTRYGPVQVKIVETSGRLTDITAIQVPNGDGHSAGIAARAVPILRTEALKADSARIDIVSGATYTSDGYAQSLQSALDNA